MLLMKCTCTNPVTKECGKCKFQECVRCCCVTMDADECRQCSICTCSEPVVTKCRHCYRVFCLKCNEHDNLCMECRCIECDGISEWKCTCDRNWCYQCHVRTECQECLNNGRTGVNICRICQRKCDRCGIVRSDSHYYSIDEDIVHDSFYCDRCINLCALCDKNVGDGMTKCLGTCGRQICIDCDTKDIFDGKCRECYKDSRGP